MAMTHHCFAQKNNESILHGAEFYTKRTSKGDSTIYKSVDIILGKHTVTLIFNGINSINKVQRTFKVSPDTSKIDDGANTVEVINRRIDPTLPEKWFDRTILYYRKKKAFTVCTPRYGSEYIVEEGSFIDSLSNFKRAKIKPRTRLSMK